MNKKNAHLSINNNSDNIVVDKSNGLSDRREVDFMDNSNCEKYDFMTASEISSFLNIGLTQAYEICKKINAELAKSGFLTFRGKVPRYALLKALPH